MMQNVRCWAKVAAATVGIGRVSLRFRRPDVTPFGGSMRGTAVGSSAAMSYHGNVSVSRRM